MTEKEQFYADVFTCIMEDYGTNSWRQVTKYKWHDKGYKYYGEICEIGDGDMEELHTVNAAVIQSGLNRLESGEVKINNTMGLNISEANKENDAGQIDAYDADAILQAGLFGELRYG